MRVRVDHHAADAAAARWLRKRNPYWNDLRIERLITATHVIEDHPDWDAPEIECEVDYRLRDREVP